MPRRAPGLETHSLSPHASILSQLAAHLRRHERVCCSQCHARRSLNATSDLPSRPRIDGGAGFAPRRLDGGISKHGPILTLPKVRTHTVPSFAPRPRLSSDCRDFLETRPRVLPNFVFHFFASRCVDTVTGLAWHDTRYKYMLRGKRYC